MTVKDVRREVLQRWGRCVAIDLDPDAGQCYDKWGSAYTGYEPVSDLEMDYVRRGSIAPRHVLAEDHLPLCPGHHRGTGPQRGHVWATSHRQEMSEYLEPYRDKVRSRADERGDETNGDG